MQEQEIHLRDYLKIIRKRRAVVIAFLVVTFATVVIGTFAVTPMYEAVCEVLIEKNESTQLTGSPVYGRFDPEFNATQVQLIRSFNVAKRVVRSLDLDGELAEYFEGESSFVSELIASTKDTLTQLLPGSLDEDATAKAGNQGLLEARKVVTTKADEITEAIIENVTIKPVRDSRIVQIYYQHQNPIIAQMIVNEIAKAYRDEVLEIRMSNSSYTIKWMSEKALEERERLEESERRLQQYMEKANIVTLEDKVAVLPEKLRELGGRLSNAIGKKNELEVLYKNVEAVGDNLAAAESISSITSGVYYQKVIGKILDAEQRREELAKKYGSKHPKMIQAIEELEALNREKRKEIRQQIRSIRNNYELIKSEVSNLEILLAQTTAEAQKFNQGFIQYGILKRDVETNRTMYEALLSQVKEKKVSEDTSNIDVWMVKAAMLPEHPVKPKKKLNILLGLVLGVFGGIGVAFFLEYLDNTVHDPEEIESRYGVSVLGLVDSLSKGERGVEAGRFVYDESATSAFAEQIKVIRTSILLSAADTPPKRILVTSSVPQEGKTTTALNLAKAFAFAGYKVVIIDADLRRPRLHKTFRIDNSKGLSAYLAGIEYEKIVHSLDNQSNLFAIPSGPMPPNPSELLGSARFEILLKSLEADFDFIFIDSAPLFGATETLFISKLARPILVARFGVTTFDHLRDSLKMLDSAKTPPLGVVLNGVDRKKAHYGYSSYKYYGYYTSSES